MPLGVVDLIEVEGDRLREIAQGFLDRVALAGYIDLKTLRYVPVLFLVDRGGQVARGTHGLSVTLESRFVVLSLGWPRPPRSGNCRSPILKASVREYRTSRV